jgi:hypothetical protein
LSPSRSAASRAISETCSRRSPGSIASASRPGVDLFELGRRGAADAGARRAQLEDLLERLDRLGVVAEPVDPQRRHAPVDRRALGDRPRPRLGFALEHPDQIVPPRQRLVLVGEGVERLGVVGIEREDRVVGVDHHDVELELVAVDLDHAL